jgi:hypothetical protein
VFLFLVRRLDYDTCELPARFTPTQRDIAEGTGYTERQIRLSMSHLDRHGWLKVFGWASRGHRHRYKLTSGEPCTCSGRRHAGKAETDAPERRKPESRKAEVTSAQRRKPLTAKPQVKPAIALRGRGEGKREETPEQLGPPETDHRYDPIPGQFACRHCRRKWSSHAYDPAGAR